MYISLDDAAKMYEIKKKRLLNLYYHDRDHKREDRFIEENGVLKVHVDYLCPHRQEIEDLYNQALETTANEKEIARIIAKKTGKKIHVVHMWLRNFKFKNHDFAMQVIAILKEYISTHNLFYLGRYA